MGKYTAWQSSTVDRLVQDHLDRVVGAICRRVLPKSLLLRGSFSQGEASIVLAGGKLIFLSDYEIVAITPRYRDRRQLQYVAREMTRTLGVETSISRVHPENIEHNSLGNTPIRGIARPTIAMYEIQQGGRTLYGEDYTRRGPQIDPAQLDPWVGLRLLLNRMAESLTRLPRKEKDWDELRWINKTLLSCVEAILILHGEYHHSYSQRGSRFARLVPQLEGVTSHAPHLPALADRATAFKLRPSLDLYPEPLPLLWDEVRQACDATLRHLAKEYLHISFVGYEEFPGRYLEALSGKAGGKRAAAHLRQNAWLTLKFLRRRRLPPAELFAHLTYPAHQAVYSVVPLMFLGCNERVLAETRHWLSQVGYWGRETRDPAVEWEHMRTRTHRAWQDLCYGMWDTLEV